jgi:hypothetical protein
LTKQIPDYFDIDLSKGLDTVRGVLPTCQIASYCFDGHVTSFDLVVWFVCRIHRSYTAKEDFLFL